MAFTLIVNCKSNSSRAEKYIRASKSLIHKKLPDCEIKYISLPNQLINEVKRSAKTSSVVIACGGDGTAQTVARGIYGTKSLMGLIPVGSGNDFAKSIGLKTRQSIEYYLDVILKQEILNVDVPIINGQIFINTAGIGFDGLTNYYASRFTKLKGLLKYTVAGFKAFLTARSFKVDGVIDDQTLSKKVWLVAVANGAVEGGKYVISPISENNDGTLEMVIVPAYSRLKLGIAFILLSSGKSLSSSFSEVIPFQKATFNIQKNHFIHLDGEIGNSSPNYVIELKNGPLKVIGVQDLVK